MKSLESILSKSKGIFKDGGDTLQDTEASVNEFPLGQLALESKCG